MTRNGSKTGFCLRLIATLLAVLTVLYALPLGAIAAYADAQEGEKQLLRNDAQAPSSLSSALALGEAYELTALREE